MTTKFDTLINIRALEPDDIDFLFNIENDMSLWKVGVNTEPSSKQRLRNYILSTTGDIYADKELRLIVELKTFAQLQPSSVSVQTVGVADLFNYSPQHNRAELAIVITKNFRQQGFATEVIKRISFYAKEILHIHQLYAFIPEDNEASKKLFAKCGFEEKITVEEWLFDGENYKNALIVQKIL